MAVKVADPTVLHKSDRGLVRIDLRTGSDVADAVRRFSEELGHDRVDVLVQPLVLGHLAPSAWSATRSSVPLVRVAGGAAGPVGSWADEVLLLPPVGAADAARAVRALQDCGPSWSATTAWRRSTSPRSRRWWRPWAGSPSDVPHVSDLTLEPVVVNAQGLFCVDVKLRIAEPPELDTGIPRRLRS